MPTEAQLLAQLHGGSPPASSSPPARPSRPLTSEPALLALLHNSNPAMSPLEDMARSAVTGVEKGVTQTLGLPNTLGQASDWLNQRAADAGAYLVGSPPLTPQQRQLVTQASHIMQAASPFGLVNSSAPSTAQMNRGVLAADAALAGPTHGALGGGFHEPQTIGGRFAETGGELAPGALLPGGPVARVARVVVPTLSGQGAAELAPDDSARGGINFKPYAKMGGSALGGLGEGFVEGIAAAPGQVLARAMPGVTDDQLGLAAALKDSAAQQGLTLTNAEALQQVTGGATGLGRLQRVLENTGRTAPAWQQFMASRPDQVRGAVMNFAGNVAPGAADDPAMLGLDANRAAQGAQIDANAVRSQAARVAGYDAADQENVDPAGIGAILQRLDEQIAADKTGLISPTLRDLKGNLTDASGAPILDQGNLSTSLNDWRDRIDLPIGSASSLSKRTGGLVGGHLNDLEALLNASPARQAGNAAYAGYSRDLVDPLAAGPVGAISRTDDVPAQTAALYPVNPPLGQPANTADALGALDAQRQGLAAALTRQHVVNTFNQASRDLTSGPNQYGGALFRRAIAGNDEQAATLNAGLGAIDPSGALGEQWGDLADALAATGRRERPGSMTASNLQDEAAMKAAPGAVRFFGGLGDPLEWTKNLSNLTGGVMYRRNLDRLTQMLQDPDLASALAVARSAPPTAAGQWLVPAVTQQPGAQP